MNLFFVGYGFKFMFDVDKFFGVVDVFCFLDLFVDFLIEWWRFFIFVFCKDEIVFFVFDGIVFEVCF